MAAWGEVRTHVQEPIPEVLLGHQAVTGRKISVNRWDRGQSHHHAPLCAGLFAGLLTSCDLSLDSVLFTQLVWEITEGEAWEKIWPLLVTYASFLLLWSKEFNLQVRQGVVWSKDEKGVLGWRWVAHGGSWFKSEAQCSFGEVTGPRDLLQGAAACSELPEKKLLTLPSL